MRVEGWATAKIRDFAWEPSERAPADAEVLSVTKHRGFVPSLEYFGKQIFSKDTDNYKLVRRGQFAYATIHLDEGSIDCLRDRDQGIISPMYTVFDVDDRKVDRSFLLELLRTPMMLERYAAIGQGSINRRKSIGFEALGSEALLLPPLPEQKKIAAILSSVDEAIQATQAVINQTRRVKEGLLQDLLTRGMPGHTRFKQTEIGEIPESWEVRTVDSVSKRVCVGYVGPVNEYYCADGVPLVRTGDLGDGFVLTEHLLHVTRGFHQHQRKSSIVPGDILIARHGQHGHACLVPESLPEANCLNVVIIRPNRDVMLAEFLQQMMNSRRLQTSIGGRSGGSTQKVINTKEVAETLVVVPPVPEQGGIVGAISALDAEIGSGLTTLAGLQHVKAGLLQDLLTGKVRVSP